MESFRPDLVPDPAVRRLSLYLRELENLQRKNRDTVSSKQLAESLGLTDAQVRKDLAYFGQFGHPGIGYKVEELIPRLRHILGTDHVWNVLLVGCGNLGRALLAYRGFAARGFKIAAVFDSDPSKLGKKHGPLIVQPMDQLAETVRRLSIRLAILAVPEDVAQQVAADLSAAGIRGLLNFAPLSLAVPNVAVAGVDLAVHLEQLSFQVKLPQQEPPPTQ